VDGGNRNAAQVGWEGSFISSSHCVLGILYEAFMGLRHSWKKVW
jgi:hypothetical protein